ncbi:MAG: thiamine pyrophosphate-dependent enzyme [Candidatus Omnitrophota bacterium]
MTAFTNFSAQEDALLNPGDSLCPGCSIPVILKLVLRAAHHPLVVSNASGCFRTPPAHSPRSPWHANWIHTQTGSAAVMSGITAMYRSLKKKGKTSIERELKFLVIGGDGATSDEGLGAISGMFERGDDIVYLCYDNQLAAHIGGQATSATPMGASTGTTPAGTVFPGKLQSRKNITAIFAAHRIPYVAQSAPWLWHDLYRKAQRAFEISGPAYLNVLSPCPANWKTPPAKTVALSKLAADTCVWPIFEIQYGTRVTVNYHPKPQRPVTEWLKTQDRFLHLLEKENKWIVDKIQEEINKDWELLLSMAGSNSPSQPDEENYTESYER